MTIARLIEKWEARARDAIPADAMLINRHVRELREANGWLKIADCLPDRLPEKCGWTMGIFMELSV